MTTDLMLLLGAVDPWSAACRADAPAADDDPTDHAAPDGPTADDQADYLAMTYGAGEPCPARQPRTSDGFGDDTPYSRSIDR